MDRQELDGTNTVMNKSSMSNGTRDVFLVFLPAVKHNWKIYVLLTTQALSHFSPIYMLKGGRKITPLGLTGSKTKPEKKIGDFINRAICKKIVKKSEEWKCSWYTHTWMGNMHRIKKWFWQNSQQNRCQLLPCQNRLMPCIQMCLSAPWSHLHLSHCRDSLDRVYYFTHLSVNTQRQTDWAPPGRPHATCFFFFFINTRFTSGSMPCIPYVYQESCMTHLVTHPKWQTSHERIVVLGLLTLQIHVGLWVTMQIQELMWNSSYYDNI